VFNGDLECRLLMYAGRRDGGAAPGA